MALVGCAVGAALLTPPSAQSNPAGTHSATGQRASTTQARSALIASGDVPDLFLLYTGDVIGYIDPCG
jgi:hypothetical protein